MADDKENMEVTQTAWDLIVVHRPKAELALV